MKTRALLTAAVMAVLVFGAIAQASAAITAYMTVEGTKQGKLKGEGTSQAHKDALPVVGYQYEVSSPRDATTGVARGKRQQKPVTITHRWGAASPQLFQACVTNEVLKTVVIDFYRTTPQGAEELWYRVKLTNAAISSIKQYAGQIGTTPPQQTVELEDVSFTFQKIEMQHLTAGTEAMDDW